MGPTREPARGVSTSPPTHRSTSDTCLGHQWRSSHLGHRVVHSQKVGMVACGGLSHLYTVASLARAPCSMTEASWLKAVTVELEQRPL